MFICLRSVIRWLWLCSIRSISSFFEEWSSRTGPYHSIYVTSYSRRFFRVIGNITRQCTVILRFFPPRIFLRQTRKIRALKKSGNQEHGRTLKRHRSKLRFWHFPGNKSLPNMLVLSAVKICRNNLESKRRFLWAISQIYE